MDEQKTHEVRYEIDRNSDDLFRAAEEFIDNHRLITLNQANGLLNVVNCEENINTVLTAYIQHQASKSTTRDPAFWNDLKREVEGLRKQAEEIQQRLGLEAEGKKAHKELRDEIHLQLARDYIQHLVAHVIYRSTLTEGR
jgi:hypothetical protein